MPSTAPLLQSAQTTPRPQIRRSISLRAPLHTDGPTPPSLVHSPLLNATNRGPALYPTTSPAVSQPSSRRPSESACSASSSSSRASSHCSLVSNASSTSAVSIFYPMPATLSPHVQRTRFHPTDPPPPPPLFHARTSSRTWASPAAPSAGHAGDVDDDPWRILDTVPAPPYRGSPKSPTPSSTPLSVRVVAPTAVPPGLRTQHTHAPHPPLSHHAQIGPYTPPELSSHQHTQTQMRRLGSGTLVVSNRVGYDAIHDPDSTPVSRNRPHSSP